MKKFIKDNYSGLTALEISLTLPVLLILIFFIIELIRINNTRTALDTIALEAVLEFIATKNTNKFEDIIEKHKPLAIPRNNIKYYFTIYSSLDNMCATAPYGSEEVFWPNSNVYSPTEAKKTYVDSNKDNNFFGRDTAGSNGYIALSNQAEPFTTSSIDSIYKISSKVFVLTFVCDFKFSSEFVKKLFAGGSNTVDKARFLVWGRGVGICN